MTDQGPSASYHAFMDRESMFLDQPDISPPASPSLTATTSTNAPQNSALSSQNSLPHATHLYPYAGMMYHPQMLPPPPGYPPQSTYSQHPQIQSPMPQAMPPYYSGNFAYHQNHSAPANFGVLNANGPATNAVPTQPPKRKRTTAGNNGRANKRQKKTTSATTGVLAPSPICGVGPPTSTLSTQVGVESQHPAAPTSGTGPILPEVATSSLSTRRYNDLPSAATDVWYFLRPLDTDAEPLARPTDEPILTYKPKSKYVGCKLCTKWKVWKNTDGMTGCFRDHFKKNHNEIYQATVNIKQLKHSGTSASSTTRNMVADDGPFSAEKFLELLQKWIVVDDQSINVLECPEFRELILYLGAGKIDDQDLPHRHKMTDLILEAYKKRMIATREELKKSLGRISFTTDLWSDPNLDSFMAVTVHFYIRDENRRLVRRNGLIAFRFVSGSHSGENLAGHFIKIVEEMGILDKIGSITMDNASNNNTLMESLEGELDRRNIPFDRDGNRIRCFPHVINIACQTIIAELKEGSLRHIAPPPMSSPPTEDELNRWNAYLEALEQDLIGKCRSLVASCRASGQRRQALLKKIEDGNKSGYWKGKLDDGKEKIRPVQLLRDCDTRWSSTFNMVDRVLELYIAIRDFLLDLDQTDISDTNAISELHKSILQDIHQVLQVAHLAQELLSGERTPTLSMTLPVFETLISKWKTLASTIPELKHFIDLGVSKLEEYASKGRKTRLYALSMILNPGQKFSWFAKTDTTGQDEKKAREWMLEAMLSYKQYERTKTLQVPLGQNNSIPIRSQSVPDIATANIARGYNRLQSLNVMVRRSSSLASIPNTGRLGSVSPSAPSSPPTIPVQETVQEAALRKARELAEDKLYVERELARYEEAGIVASLENSGMVNIDAFWSVNEYEYPFLFRVAMDVLPAQASSVPCERVFSSSKETCALRRNRVSRLLLEALQVLKFSYKNERLSFVEELAKESDYIIAGPLTETAIDELLKAGKLEELEDLVKNMADSS